MDDNLMSNEPYLSVVVPVYGSGEALPELRERLDRTLRERNLSYELILVDDRCPGNAWQIIQALASSYSEVIGARLARNFGQHAATIGGIALARGEWIVTMDDDLEHIPEAIPALLEAADTNHSLVYGTFNQRTHSSFRNYTSEIMRRLLKWAFPELNQEYTSFRLMQRSLAKQLETFNLHHPYIDGFLSWMTASVRTVEVKHDVRKHGRSGYTLLRLIGHAVNIFVTFSHLPLRIATYGGTLLAAGSFLFLMYTVYERLIGNIGSPGYASLMSAVLFTCGIQLLMLGLIGEYIGRLMGATYRRPVYVVETVTTRKR
jgi:undecaprenyl-phosphate 4-deoxy-4-formamido-L-arabinose transferase